MGSVWDDDRVRSGMTKQLAERRRRLDAGERPIGWKVAFGAPQSKDTVGLDGPVVGFLTDRSLLDPGGSCSLTGWTKPALEPEIAVQLRADLAPRSSRADVEAAIGTLRPAIELADVDRPLDDLKAIIADNIFHRRVALGPAFAVSPEAPWPAFRVEVSCNGDVVAKTDDPAALVGDLLDVVGHVADYLAAFGQPLRTDDVVITGSTVPLIWPQPDERYDFSLQSVGEVAVRLVP